MAERIKIPRAKSPGEEAFALHCRAENLNPEREYRFHPVRKWKFDYCFPWIKLAVEIEGGSGIYGRHQRPGGFKADCEKYNAAALMGWRVLRYSTDMVLRGDAITDVLEALK